MPNSSRDLSFQTPRPVVWFSLVLAVTTSLCGLTQPAGLQPAATASNPAARTLAALSTQTYAQDQDSEVDPPVTPDDLKIVQRARSILNTPAQWNRADNRKCPDAATTFSLYCALRKATVEVTGDFAHRGAAMQQARFVIDEDLARGNHYQHRLMNYNNDPSTTFADVQRFFDLLEQRIQKRLNQKNVEAPHHD